MLLFEKHGLEDKALFQCLFLNNFSFPMHFHRAYELIYVNSGEMIVSIGQQEHRLCQGDLAFIFSNQLHEFKGTAASDIAVLLFSPELIGDFYAQYHGQVPQNGILRNVTPPPFASLQTVYAQKSFLYAICDLLTHNTGFIPFAIKPKSNAMYQVLLYVEQHYASACTLKHISRHLQYDYAYLSKQFIHFMNMPFTEYLNQYRISQACYLIRNTRQPIGDIALQCGYENLRTFHRNFKRQMQRTPLEYRLPHETYTPSP